LTDAKAGPHPVVFLILCLPFGAASGYLVVTLAYLLRHAGVGVGDIAWLIALSFWPQVLKFLWAPVVDTTLTSKTWYVLAAVASGATLVGIGVYHPSTATFVVLTALVFVNNIAISFLGMAAESLMAHATRDAEKGRAGGWYQAGNLGGQGIGGGVALWIAQHTPVLWLPGAAMGALFLLCCTALWFVDEPDMGHRHLNYVTSIGNVLRDVWDTAWTRVGALALLICFLPIGSGAASGLWASIAGDWHASADTVALVNGVLGGVASIVGSLIGGYLCDRMNRQFGYALFGVVLSVVTLAMLAAARSPAMFVTFTLAYAFVQGLNYASFSAVVLEAIGRGAAATKYNVYACLSNIPIMYMTAYEGTAYDKWHASGLLVSDALSGVAGVAFFALVALVFFPRRAPAAA
jgi:MFS transporter, PAT family, beta-lactamase induction signal transducer AmpG